MCMCLFKVIRGVSVCVWGYLGREGVAVYICVCVHVMRCKIKDDCMLFFGFQS